MIQRRPDEKLNPEIDSKNITSTDKPSNSVTAPKTELPSKTAVPTSDAGTNTAIVKDVEPEVNGAVRRLQMLGFAPLVVGITAWAMV